MVIKTKNPNDEFYVKEEYLFEELTYRSNFLEQMRLFVDKQPIYYDEAKMWWIWNFREYKWEIIDEITLMNYVDKYTKYPGVKHQIKSETLEALKRIGRIEKPEPIKPTWVQFKNIIIDYETGEEFEASPRYFATNPIPWELGNSDETINMDLIF